MNQTQVVSFETARQTSRRAAGGHAVIVRREDACFTVHGRV